MERANTYFYSKFVITEIIRNNFWKYFAIQAITIAIVLFHNDFQINFSKISFSNFLLLLLGVIGPLIGISFVTKEVKLENDAILYRKSFSNKWKIMLLSEISHICYFQKPLHRYSIFPRAFFYAKQQSKITILELMIPKQDIYKLLSILYEKNIPVLLFKELKNIEETKYYIRTTT